MMSRAKQRAARLLPKKLFIYSMGFKQQRSEIDKN